MYDGFHISKPGHSHIQDGRVCQDYSGTLCSGSTFAVAAVSDGHGSPKHFRSDAGSRLAVETALRQAGEFLNNHRDRLNEGRHHHEILKQLAISILSGWLAAVRAHYDENPLTVEEAAKCSGDGADRGKPENFYGATLIFGVMTEKYVFAAQTGDGACVLIDRDGKASRPAELRDDRLEFGLTTSLCDSAAIENFRFYFSRENLPEAVFLSTDGVTDSYTGEAFLEFNGKVLMQMRAEREAAEKELADWLPRLSERGSRDDMTLAGVFRLNF
jgi:serine/threonine protein phosphatase PrpC